MKNALNGGIQESMPDMSPSEPLDDETKQALRTELEELRREKRIRKLAQRLLDDLLPELQAHDRLLNRGDRDHDEIAEVAGIAGGLVVADLYERCAQENLSQFRRNRVIDRTSELITDQLKGRNLTQGLSDRTVSVSAKYGLTRLIRARGIERIERMSDDEIFLGLLAELQQAGIDGRLEDVLLKPTARFAGEAAHDALGRIGFYEVVDLAALAKLLGLRKVPGRPSQPYVLPAGGLRQTMSNQLYQKALHVLMDRSLFKLSPASLFPVAVVQGKGTSLQVSLQPVQLDGQRYASQDEQAALAREMERLRESLTDIDSDVFEILAQIHLQQQGAAQDFAEATIDDVLRQRGVQAKKGGQGRRGGFNEEQRRQVGGALAKINSLFVRLGSVDGRSVPPDTPGEGRLFEVVNASGQLITGDGQATDVIRFRPGPLLRPSLVGKWRQTMWVSARALTYSGTKEQVEKRLTRYFAGQWRIRARDGNFLQPYRVQTLVNAIAFPLQGNNPKRSLNRFEAALTRLEDDGVIAAWQYDDWDDEVYSSVRKGLIAHWLGWSIVVEPPDAVREAYRSLLQKGRKPAPTRESIAREVRARRRQLNVTTLIAAEQVGINKQEFLDIEHGKRSFRSGVPARLRCWLEG